MVLFSWLLLSGVVMLYRNELNKPPTRAPQGLRRLAAVVRFLAFCCVTFALVGGGFFLWFDRTYSQALQAVLDHRPPVVTLLADDGTKLARMGVRHPSVSIDDLPPVLIDAVIATEDRRFYSHFGVDVIGLSRAIATNLMRGRLREGGSTITQQLVKNVFLSRKRNLTRKFRELVISLWLEVHFDKRQILEFYFNRVYFGIGARKGIASASRAYFDKKVAELSLAEAALLAGLLKAPSYYAPTRSLPRAHARASIVLDNMVAVGAIGPQQAAEARRNPAALRRPSPSRRVLAGTDYAVDWIMERLQQQVGVIETDLVVKTSLDRKLQIRAQQLVRRMIEQQGVEKHLDQAAAVMLDENGAVKLMVGGASYRHSQFNRAVKARRQPGSSFKPFVYLAAMESGLTPDSVEIDERIKIDDWRPRNASRFYRGPVTLRMALAKSINSVAVKLARDTGLKRVRATARRLGISSKLALRPSLALGSSEVTPLEITTAYVPFMNGGYGVTPHIIKEVVTADGAVLHEAPRRRHRAVDPSYVYDMNDMLGAVISGGTGRRAHLEDHPAAGKTGTSQDYRDAWFLGYTGHFTCGVWAGNDDNSPTHDVSGGRLPALLWKQIMQAAHAELPRRELPGLSPDTVDGEQIVILDEQLPIDDIIVGDLSADNDLALLTEKAEE